MKGRDNMKLENLTTQEIIEILKTTKKGCYHSLTRKVVENNGYYTIKTYVIRFCSYAKVSGKEENENSGNGNGNRITIIPNILYYNSKTENYLLMVCTTKRKANHCKVHYYDNNGNEISKSEYEMVNPPKKTYNNVSVVFQLKLKEIVEIK